MKRKIRRLGSEDDDPLSGVANFFDLGIVFALGFILALLAASGSGRLTRSTEGAASAEGEPVPETAECLPRYRESRGQLTGAGERLGTAYRLSSGEVVYVPDGEGAAQRPAP